MSVLSNKELRNVVYEVLTQFPPTAKNTAENDREVAVECVVAIVAAEARKELE